MTLIELFLMVFLIIFALLYMYDTYLRKYNHTTLAKKLDHAIQKRQHKQKQKHAIKEELHYKCGCIIIEQEDKYQFVLKRICPKHFQKFYAHKNTSKNIQPISQKANI